MKKLPTKRLDYKDEEVGAQSEVQCQSLSVRMRPWVDSEHHRKERQKYPRKWSKKTELENRTEQRTKLESQPTAHDSWGSADWWPKPPAAPAPGISWPLLASSGTCRHMYTQAHVHVNTCTHTHTHVCTHTILKRTRKETFICELLDK